MSAFWRDHYRHASKIKPEMAEQTIEEIRRQHGVVSPSIVVKHAVKARHPLHPCFTWDDGKAAEEYRLWEARELLGALVTITKVDGDGEIQTRAYVAVSIPDQAERDYKPIRVAMRDDRQEVLEQALAELGRWRAKYAKLEELADVFALIDMRTPEEAMAS